VGLAAWAWTNARVHTLSLEVATELMRVTWPSWEETRVSTIAVVVASLVAAVLLFGMDTLAYKMMVEWLPALWGKLS
jgi:preprotein translocase subunit SecE